MDIQLLVVILFVAGSLVYLGRRLYEKLIGKKKGGCDSCGIEKVIRKN